MVSYYEDGFEDLDGYFCDTFLFLIWFALFDNDMLIVIVKSY